MKSTFRHRGRSLSTYAVGGRGGVIKMQTEAYRGEGGSVKCVHTQCIIMPVFIVKQNTASRFGRPHIATDHCTVAPGGALVKTLLLPEMEAIKAT